MKYIQMLYYIIVIKIKTKQRLGQIIFNANHNSGCDLFYMTDGWMWSVLKRRYDAL
jgi:hypothetical protein